MPFGFCSPYPVSCPMMLQETLASEPASTWVLIHNTPKWEPRESAWERCAMGTGWTAEGMGHGQGCAVQMGQPWVHSNSASSQERWETAERDFGTKDQLRSWR